VDTLVSESGMRREKGTPAVRFLVTDDPEHFARVGEAFLGRKMEGVEKVTL
jgi:hypothetical protein